MGWGSDFVNGALNKAAQKTGNKEFAQACIKVLKDKLGGKLTEEQFKQACDLLEHASKQFREPTPTRHYLPAPKRADDYRLKEED